MIKHPHNQVFRFTDKAKRKFRRDETLRNLCDDSLRLFFYGDAENGAACVYKVTAIVQSDLDYDGVDSHIEPVDEPMPKTLFAINDEYDHIRRYKLNEMEGWSPKLFQVWKTFKLDYDVLMIFIDYIERNNVLSYPSRCDNFEYPENGDEVIQDEKEYLTILNGMTLNEIIDRVRAHTNDPNPLTYV